MSEVGEVRAKFVAEDGEWHASIERIDASIKQVSDTAESGFRTVTDAVTSAGGSISEIATTVDDVTQALTFAAAVEGALAAMSQIAEAVNVVREAIVKAGEASDDLGDRLRGPFAAAAEEMRQKVEQQLVLGFNPKSTEKAIVTLHKFGQDTDANLKLVQDAARFTEGSIEGLSAKFGQLLEATDEKTIGRNVKSLQRDLGASGKDLESFGAKLDAAGKVLLDTPARVEAARAALIEFTQVRAGGAADRVADDTERMKGEFELLKREVGASIITFRESFSPALREVIGTFRNLSPEVKGFIGLSVEFAGAAGSMAAGALQVGANIALLAANKTVYTAATTAATAASGAFNASLAVLGGTIGAVLLVVGAAAVGVYAYTEAIKGQTKAEEALLALEERRARALKDNISLVGKTADQIRELGKGSKDVVSVIDGLRDQVEAAKKAGNAVLVAELEAKISQAQQVKAELAQGEAADAEKKKQALRDAVNDPSEKEKKAAAKARAAEERALKKQQDAEARELARLVKEEQKAEEKDRKDALAEDLALVKNAAAAKQITKQQEIEGLREVLDTHKVTAAERRQIEREIANLVGQLEREKTAALKKAESERLAEQKRAARERQAEAKRQEQENAKEVAQLTHDLAEANKKSEQDLKERRDAQKATRSAQVKEIAEDVKHLEDVAVEKKTKTVDQIKVLLDKKLALELAEIEAERVAQAEKASTPGTLAAINEEAEAKIRTARKQTTNELEKEVEKQKKIIADAKNEDSAFASGPFGLDELAKQLKGTTTGSRFARATLDGVRPDAVLAGGLKEVATAGAQVKYSVATPAAATLTANQKESAGEIGKQVALAIKTMPLNITIDVINTDGAKDSKTFSAGLGAFPPKNVFNSKSPLGRV